MPPVKPRDMEDTWAPGELEKSLKGAKEDKKRHRERDRDRDRRDRHKDDDEHRRRRKDEDGDKPREKRDRDREKRDRDKDREKRDRDKDREKRDRDKDREKRDREKDKEKRDRDKDREKQEHKDRRHHDRENVEDDEERKKRREERRKRKEEEGQDGKERRRRHRDDEDEKGKKSKKDSDESTRPQRRRHADEDEDKRRHRRTDDDTDRRQHHRDRGGEERRRKHDENGDVRNREQKERRNRPERDEERHKQQKEKGKEKKEEKERESHGTRKGGKATSLTEPTEKKRSRASKTKSSKKKEMVSRPNAALASGSGALQYQGYKAHSRLVQKQSKVGKIVEKSRKAIPSSLKDTLPLRKNSDLSEERGGKPFSDCSQKSLLKQSAEKAGSQEEEKEPEDDEYNYDDDEFEDYEEDFEEDDEEDEEDGEHDKVKKSGGKELDGVSPRNVRDISSSYIRSKNWQGNSESREEMDEILRAMNAENERLLQESRSGDWDTPSPTDDRSTKRPSTGKKAFINFGSAKQRQISTKASSKAKTRGRELLQIIELDRAVFDMFDMAPVGEYELYMRTFGRSDTKQVYVQTNEDNIEREIQTEEIETREKWTQYPTEDSVGCGGDEVSTEESELKPLDTAALTKFVQQAGQVMLILLEEGRAQAAHTDVARKRSNICLSEAFLELPPPSFLQSRSVSFTHFSSSQTHLLLTIYDKPKKVVSGDGLARRGFICVWNVNEPSQPQKILTCEGQPQCCCFSPVKPTQVFAGMGDGSVAVWDLREPNSLHKSLPLGEEEWLLRYPTYNTAGVLQYENHQSAITSVVPILSPGDATELGEEDVDSATSFQLATLDEAAVVHLWVVAEISQPDPGGSESDLGLAPGGKVKLIKSNTITLENPLRDARLRTSMRAFEMQLLPTDPSHFYIGTDMGHVIHGVRYGGRAPPRAYRPDIDAPVDVTTLDFSPFTEPIFLTGCADGSIRLYHTKYPYPLISWDATTEGRPILTVRWCRSRPSVFFVVDTSSHLYIWDLLMSDSTPMKEETISEDRLTSFCLSNDYAATGLGAPGRKPAMAVSFETGCVEVHTVSQQFSAMLPEEVDQLAQFISATL